MRGVVLEAAGFRRIVRGRDHDAVGQAGLAAAIVGEDGVRDRRGRGVVIVFRQHDIDAVGGKHLERTGQGRLGERMGVDTQEERTVGLLLSAVEANGLGDGQDVPLVERAIEGRATVTRGAKGNPLLRNLGIGALFIIGGDQLWYVDQVTRLGQLSSSGIDGIQGGSTSAFTMVQYLDRPLSRMRGWPVSRFSKIFKVGCAGKGARCLKRNEQTARRHVSTSTSLEPGGGLTYWQESLTMPQSTHDRVAELHNLAAHAHSAAATAHGKGDHLTAHELSMQAHEHSVNAHKLSEELALKAGKA